MRMRFFFVICTLFCISLSAQQVQQAQQTEYDRAWMAYITGQYEEALVSLEQCIEQDSTNYRYIFLKGKALENLYRYADAIAAQHIALQLNPDGLDAMAALGALYHHSGQPAVSAQFFEKLAAAEPDIVRWKMNWAIALQASGKPELALEQLKIVEQKDTTNWLVYKNMGDCYYRIDSLFETFNHYYTALKLYPHNNTLWGTLTRILVMDKQYDGAVEVGMEAVEMDATNVEAWKYLGIAYYRLGNASLADIALRNALALGDSSYTAMSHYGVISYFLQNYGEAEKYLEKAHQLEPEDINTMKYLAFTYGFTGKPKKGLEVLDELDMLIADIDTVGMRANIQRGYLLRLLSRYYDAAKVYIVATKDFPTDPSNFYEVAVCYDLVRNRKLAIEWYSRFLEKIDPKWATRQWTERELNRLEHVKNAMGRIEVLKEDLFFEEGRKR